MNFTSFTHRCVSLLHIQDNQVRWAIFTVGMAVNGAILFYPSNHHFTSTRFDHSSTYQPNAAVSMSQDAATNVPQHISNEFEQANLLAVTGHRDAATDLYIQAMSNRIVEQSQQ